MKSLQLLMIRLYRAGISPALPAMCRYQPTCSEYAYEAIERHGVMRGSWMALRRLSRCRPGGGHGVDPVPDP
jgi:putative membrane protein insertion efficiency factor